VYKKYKANIERIGTERLLHLYCNHVVFQVSYKLKRSLPDFDMTDLMLDWNCDNFNFLSVK
jgi:hypothetical protein